MRAEVCSRWPVCAWLGIRATGAPQPTHCGRCGAPIARVDPKTGRFAQPRLVTLDGDPIQPEWSR